MFVSERIFRGMKGDKKEGHVERVGSFPGKQETHDKLCRMRHVGPTAMLGTIIKSKGSKNRAAEMNATESCLSSCSTASDQHTDYATS